MCGDVCGFIYCYLNNVINNLYNVDIFEYIFIIFLNIFIFFIFCC